MDVTMNGDGVVLCATLVERENGRGPNELNVTSTSTFNVSFCSCSLRISLCFRWVESELLFINLAGNTVYRGSSLSVRTILN